jgi:peptidyl-prolyl cis-trans isomerase SurA
MHSKSLVSRVPLAVVAAALVVLVAAASRAEIIEQVLVKINGDILTKTELEARQVAALRQRGQQQLSDQDLRKAVADITPQVLVDTIDEYLLLQRGRELGYRLGDEQFKSIVDNIKKENKIETEEQFQAALKQENMTLADLRRQLERQMIITRVQQAEVLGRISVSEDEAKAYYEAHKNEFTTPSSMMIREILVAVPNDPKGLNVGRDEEAKAKAEALRARVLKGENFEKVASEASDSSSKSNGGLVGPISKEDLAPALRQVFDQLKVGEISPVVRTQGGYQFFKLESMTETKVLPLAQVRDQIADKVANEKRGAEFEKYLEKLRSQAIIEWKNPELKKLYDERVAELAKQATPAQAAPKAKGH